MNKRINVLALVELGKMFSLIEITHEVHISESVTESTVQCNISYIFMLTMAIDG